MFFEQEIYEKFFPYGSEYFSYIVLQLSSVLCPDVARYAHHVFNAFDVTSSGSISFRVRKNFVTSGRNASDKL